MNETIPFPIPDDALSTTFGYGVVKAFQGDTLTDEDGKRVGIQDAVTYDVYALVDGTIIKIEACKPSQPRSTHDLIRPVPPGTPCPVYITAGQVQFQIIGELSASKVCT